MKKLLLSLFVLTLTASSFAVVYNKADVPDYRTQPQVYIDYWLSVDSPAGAINAKLSEVTKFQIILDKTTIWTPALIKAKVNTNAVSFGITDPVIITSAKIYNLYSVIFTTKLDFRPEALALTAGSTNPRILFLKGIILYYQKKYAEALAVFTQIERTAWQIKCAVAMKNLNVLLAVANEQLLINTTKDPKLIITIISEFEKLPVSSDPAIIAGVLDKLIDLSAKYPPAVPVAGTEANWAKAAAMVDYRIKKLQAMVNAKIDLANKLAQ
ncbi:MAG: hypothetical protein L3J71_03450 [Victivallaceae bacterium]|nr:hypothetical protein [Victivallaceae bacterium]